MKNKTKIFLSYFPVMLVSMQIGANIIGLLYPVFYVKIGFYLNTFIGTNVLFAMFLVAYTQFFRFCSVSRYAAWAELAFGVNYLVIQEDNLYNVLFQITVGVLALALTFKYYIEKFPLCKISLLTSFIGKVFKYKGNCEKAFDKWDAEMTINVRKHIVINHTSHKP